MHNKRKVFPDTTTVTSYAIIIFLASKQTFFISFIVNFTLLPLDVMRCY